MSAFDGLGTARVLAGVLGRAAVLQTQVLTNNAATIVMFPIALSAAGRSTATCGPSP
ncbi:MAG: hypothetical protein NVS3B26_26450 [Mycobacteriales bacterium]